MDHDAALNTGAVARVDAILADHAAPLAGDFGGYRNHARRIAIFCSALSGPAPDAEEKIAIAAAFHDLGIWTDGTFDYLDPSVTRAVTYLEQTGRCDWTPEIRSMILGHHAIRPATGLEEAFRRADWIDVSLGIRRFGLPRSLIRQSFARFPSAGFHTRLVTLALRRFRSHPLDPLPMLRW
jgi:hypothetical protein